MVTKTTAEHCNGQILLQNRELPQPCNDCQEAYAFTIHKIQGETVEHRLFIDTLRLCSDKIMYTALSRARHKQQVHFILPPSCKTFAMAKKFWHNRWFLKNNLTQHVHVLTDCTMGVYFSYWRNASLWKSSQTSLSSQAIAHWYTHIVHFVDCWVKNISPIE